MFDIGEMKKAKLLVSLLLTLEAQITYFETLNSRE